MVKQIDVITIDGPAGSGKSTVAKGVAKKLGYLYIDTGAMYRALTLKAVREKININDEKSLVDLSENLDIKLEDDKEGLKVFLDGQDVSEEIRSLSISEYVKYLAKIKDVRKNMVNIQRVLAKRSKGAVMEGRDIGTVVFPDAKYKFYLDASVDERIKRRYKEFARKGVNVTLDDVKKDVKERDHSDTTRDAGPLKKASDAVYIDTTSKTVEHVIEEILKRLLKKS